MRSVDYVLMQDEIQRRKVMLRAMIARAVPWPIVDHEAVREALTPELMQAGIEVWRVSQRAIIRAELGRDRWWANEQLVDAMLGDEVRARLRRQQEAAK